jgi:hypothetical protein
VEHIRNFFRRNDSNNDIDEIEIDKYLNEFKTKSEKSKKVEEALKQALDIRKFEIELYWKRATYFWTIIGVIFAGYFLLLKSDGLKAHSNLILLVNCIGFLFFLSWWLVNRGSKFWQNNWERHVDLLEDDIMGPLYKRVIQTGDLNWFKIHKEYNYSVSKINQFLSFFVTLIWLGMGIYVFIEVNGLGWNFLFSSLFKSIALVVCTVIAALVLIFFGQSDAVKQNTDTNKTLVKQRNKN